MAAAVGAAYADIVVGDGRVATEERRLGSFSSIRVDGSGTLLVHRGAQKVRVTSDSNILPYITTTVSGDELRISFKPFTAVMSATKMQFEVSLPELSGLFLSGSGDARVDPFKGDSFKANISGSGGIKADLEYRGIELGCSGSGGYDATVRASRLELNCTGSGDAFINGSADRADARISGSGALGARDFAVGDARIIISGSGKAEIRATKSLDIALSGSGKVKYWGNPAVTQRTSGSGSVTKAGE